MSQPTKVSLTKGQMKKVLSQFNGTKKRKGIKNARKISQDLEIPHRQVMYFLEEEGLRYYAFGSYC